MKTRSIGGLLVLGAGLSFEACSSPGVGFSAPGVAGFGGVDRGGAGPTDAGDSNGGLPGRSGAGGSGDTGGDAGEAGDGGEHASGAGGSQGGTAGAAPGGAGAGGAAPRAGSGGVGAAGTAAGGAGAGGTGVGGAGTGGTEVGGAGVGGAGVGGAGVGGAGTGGVGVGGAGTGGTGVGGAGTGGTGVGGAGAGPGGAGNGGGTSSALCGNNVLESGEQCDDGNTRSLDACAANCAFEQSQRATWFKVQFDTDSFCQANRFGSAFPSLTRSVLQQSIDARVADGTFSVLFAFSGLADPTGPNGSAFSIGVLNGAPAAGAGYDGRGDLDWWYAPSAATLDANKNPLSKLTGQISAGTVRASGPALKLPLLSTAPLNVSSAQLRLPIGASSKPLSSAGAPPGHLPAERLSPTLRSFASGGTATDAGAGELCGNISAASLQSEQIPADYLSNGSTPCTQRYTANNSLLDALVGGCSIGSAPFIVPALTATQPDTADPNVINPGSGAPYLLVANASRVVNVCRDKNNGLVDLSNCLAAAAYSSAFKLATDRVIVK